MIQLHEMVKGFPPTLVSSLQEVMPDLPQFIELCVLLIAPVGVFLFFVWLGDVIHRPEIWTGADLTLLLSGIGALIIVQGMGLPVLSTGYLLTLFQWVAYLIQPFSFAAAAVVFAGNEVFRRTLHYTLFRDVIIITGGLWTRVENVIPLHQIERIILVQGRLGYIFQFGTVVPEGKVFGHSVTDISVNYRPGDALHPDKDQVFTLRWQQGSSNPLICLYGISNPDDVKSCIEKAMQQASEKVD